MSAAPPIECVDHVHVFVSDRLKAIQWYLKVMGMEPVPEYLHWADGGGPLVLSDKSGSLHLALFERPVAPNRATIAVRCTAAAYVLWWRHLQNVLGEPPEFQDHGQAWSLYFCDPDSNPYEVTCYDVEDLRQLMSK